MWASNRKMSDAITPPPEGIMLVDDRRTRTDHVGALLEKR